MKNKKMILGMAIIVVFTFSTTACFGQNNSGGGKTFNNAEDLKKYLDSQPVNSPDKPIKVSMTINDPMIEKVAEVIKSAGKYVSLNISGNALTTIPNYAFEDCKSLVNITIPDSVTKIGSSAFYGTSLNSINIPNGVTSIGSRAFSGTNLTSVTIPNSVKSIDNEAFVVCKSLVSVTFQGTISKDNLGRMYPFIGDLVDKYITGGVGTYTKSIDKYEWTKQ